MVGHFDQVFVWVSLGLLFYVSSVDVKASFCAFKVKPVLINKATIKQVLILYPYIIQLVIKSGNLLSCQ